MALESPVRDLRRLRLIFDLACINEAKLFCNSHRCMILKKNVCNYFVDIRILESPFQEPADSFGRQPAGLILRKNGVVNFGGFITEDI